MAINYAAAVNRNATPQSQPIPGSTQVPNSAGGFAWQVDDWTRLERFLVLGAEGGTFYIREQNLVKQNHDAIVRCILMDGLRVVSRIVEISDSGRAPKNDPAIFALALVATHGDSPARSAALASLPRVCRTGTHLFHFAEYVNAMRGWGRGLRNAVVKWYLAKDARGLAFHAVKYQQRDGWSHGDLLRLAHPKAATREQDAVFRWILKGSEGLGARNVSRKVNGQVREVAYGGVGEVPALIQAFETAKRATSVRQIVELIRDFDLPREAIPTQWLNEAAVWEALLDRMPMTAMIRNLGKMTSVGLLKPFSSAARTVVERLKDQAALKQARIHPLAVLVAQKVYAQGRGDKGDLTWKPLGKIVDALDETFYVTFSNVTPCGKPVLLALDVSGSMGGSMIAGSCLSAREASAAMALITAATELDYHIMGFSNRFMPLNISPRMRLDQVIKKIDNLPFEATDCALPMLWAKQNRVNVSGFVTYTDSETWAGNIHPAQALRSYREEFGVPAKAVVVGMTSNGFTIADPNDRGMLDVVGFDSSVPAVIADFIRQ